MATASNKLAAVDNVEIDVGRFKYVLIELTIEEHTKRIVRGHKWAEYHGK